MKLLKIVASGLPLFSQSCEIDFLPTQRVTSDNAEKMSCLFSKGTKTFYQNNVLAFIGINASGKTTILKLISFVCKMLNNEAINSISYNEILDGLNENQDVIFDTYFYTQDNMYHLNTIITKQNDKFIIKDECLTIKLTSTITSKTDITVFDNCKTILKRNNNDAFLLDDVSIMVAFNKKNKDTLFVADLLQYTNINQLSISKDCPPELIAFFDTSVEYLHVEKNGNDLDIRLKFKNKEELILNQFSELNRYLSSGTIKGINTFLTAMKTFKLGGYMIVDELENHFNHEIVSTLIRFYMDKKVNTTGAVLLFSTHYAELLDEFDRNDNIYIVRNNNGITADNLSTILKRNDIKKSEAYQSSFFEGTAPMYDAYMQLKKHIINSSRED